MGWRLSDVKRVAEQHGVRFGTRGTHSIDAVLGDKLAPLPWHSGDKTEVEVRDIRSFCRKLGLDPNAFLDELRGR